MGESEGIVRRHLRGTDHFLIFGYNIGSSSTQEQIEFDMTPKGDIVQNNLFISVKMEDPKGLGIGTDKEKT